VLDNLNTFQVVVPFAEADAARVEPNQKVDVTFDSVPDLVRHGTVVAVAPTGTNIQDVTNYYVTIVLNELDPRLKDGQTAQTSVIVSQLENVLVVPNGAIQQGGSTGVVSVLQPDGSQRQVQVQLGMVGDGVTQVLSGLREGQRVVVAQS
jgi:HlyD family secretion protein